MKIHQPIVGFCLAALLSACGGGSSGGTAAGPAPSSPSVSTGIFLDSPVSGISYTTATQSGKTNAKGEFSYVAGENITFSIGSIQLPAVLANATITPLDIAKTTDINNQVVSNILVLLQSLDEDGNPANGISISAAAATAATAGVSFDVSSNAFSANAAVSKLVANSGSVNKTLIAEATAKAHFQSTLSGTPGTTKINVAPVANAGAVQSLLAGAVVILDASASSDANNDTLTYLWALTTKPSGSTAALSAPASAKPTFTADVAGAYVATLVVNDGKLDSTASTVTVTASAANAAPVANAGAAQSVLVKSPVALNGAASSDANGDALTYAWTLTSKPAGSTATLTNMTSANPTFVLDVAGSYVASLIVNDGKLSSSAATVTLTAAVANVAPVANAGVAQNVVAGNAVTLDGSASSDGNGDALTYAWTLTSRPAGSAALLASSTSVKPTLTADVAGTYVATLVVNDGKLNSAAATITVTAAVANVAPVANAGVAQNVVAGSAVTLDGSASSDANGDALTYAWTLTSKPAGSAAALAGATAAKPTLTADVAGTYVATLVVNDGKLNSTAATITVTAAVANVAPVANAGVAQSVYRNATVTLDGTASSDANGDTLTYAWVFVSKPTGSFFAALTNATAAKPTFMPDMAGSYVLSLTVNDGRVNSAAATVTISVLDGAGPTPSATGLIVQNSSNFYVLNEQSMLKSVDFSCGRGFSAIDRAPDGTLVATDTGRSLVEINPITGVCVTKGNTPEWIKSFAIASNGAYYGISFSQYATPTGVAHRMYRLSSSGASLSYVPLSGVSTYVNAIDFGPDGTLFGVGITSGGQWSIVTIDPVSGVTVLVAPLIVQPDGDIDIDSSEILRGVSNGNLIKISLRTGALLSSQPIPGFGPAFSLSPIVFVP